MGELKELVTELHQKTERDYLGRMRPEKPLYMAKASEYGFDYWDGGREFGYGGYTYLPGRFLQLAKNLINIYELKAGSKILDVGCGKGFLLKELLEVEPGLEIVGFDVSSYAIDNCHPDLSGRLFVQSIVDPLPYKDGEFDLVLSLAVLHNLKINELKYSLNEIERVGKKKFVMVESYRNFSELFNLQCWALTCQSFYSHDEWVWIFENFGYSGDFEFIYFK